MLLRRLHRDDSYSKHDADGHTYGYSDSDSHANPHSDLDAAAMRVYDINDDGVIDLSDINDVLFHSIFVNAEYDARYDLVPDGVVDIADIFAVATHYNEACGP